MNNDLISREALKEQFNGVPDSEDKDIALMLIDNAPTVDIKDQMAGAYNEGYACGSRENTRPQGEWIDHSEEGYVECPFCEHLTNCEDNIDELHYCWNCGAKMLNAADVALADASAKKPEEKNGGKP